MSVFIPLLQEISVFSGVSEKVLKNDVLFAVLKEMETNAKLKERTERLRTLPKLTAEDKKELKEKKQKFPLSSFDGYKLSLPSATFGGTFSHRAAAGIISPSGVIVSDIDHLSETTDTTAEELKRLISQDEHCLFAFISPSGDGVKAAFFSPEVKNDADNKRFYFALERYVKEKYRHKLDVACKDISRLTFLCYDREIFINDRALPFPMPDAQTQQRQPERRAFLSAIFAPSVSSEEYTEAEICEVLERVPIGGAGTGTYNNLLSAGLVLKDIFGAGRARALLESWADCRAEDVEKVISWQGNGGKVGLGTLIELAKDNGLDVTAWSRRRFQRIEENTKSHNFTQRATAENDLTPIAFHTQEQEPELLQKRYKGKRVSTFAEVKPTEELKYKIVVLFPRTPQEYADAEECQRRLTHRCKRVAIESQLLESYWDKPKKPTISATNSAEKAKEPQEPTANYTKTIHFLPPNEKIGIKPVEFEVGTNSDESNILKEFFGAKLHRLDTIKKIESAICPQSPIHDFACPFGGANCPQYDFCVKQRAWCLAQEPEMIPLLKKLNDNAATSETERTTLLDFFAEIGIERTREAKGFELLKTTAVNAI